MRSWCPFCSAVGHHADDCVMKTLDAMTARRVLVEMQIDGLLEDLRPEDRTAIIRKLVRVYNVDSPR